MISATLCCSGVVNVYWLISFSVNQKIVKEKYYTSLQNAAGNTQVNTSRLMMRGGISVCFFSAGGDVVTVLVQVRGDMRGKWNVTQRQIKTRFSLQRTSFGAVAYSYLLISFPSCTRRHSLFTNFNPTPSSSTTSQMYIDCERERERKFMGPWEMKGVCAVTWLRVYYYAQTRGHPSPCEEERPQKPHEDQFKRDINEENHNKQKADVIIKSRKQSTNWASAL